MRDLLLTGFVIGLLPFILKIPRWGANAWAWLSMMNPHRAAYGFAHAFPFAQMVAVTTLVGYVFTKDRRPFPVNKITVVYLLFIVWMSITCLFAIADIGVVMAHWLFALKIHLMLFVTLMLIRSRKQIETLVWIVTFSIGFYGIKGGLWTILTGGGGRVWGPEGSMIEDNNGLGLALVMLVPFVYYLHYITQRRWIRYGLLAAGVLMCFSILGSQSRGGLLALIAMALVLAIKGRRPILMSALLVVGLTSAFLFMPSSWSSRMETIKSYEQDASAMSRIQTWHTMWNLAVDRPFVGGGYGADNAVTFALYSPDPQKAKVLVAHSIYFEALGEHGFPGVILYLLLGFFTWRSAGNLAKRTRNDPEFRDWVPVFMKMAQVSLLGFAVGGAFLSLVHFDLPYYIVGFVILAETYVKEQQSIRALGVDRPKSDKEEKVASR